MKTIKNNGFYISAPTKFNLAGISTFELQEATNIKVLLLVGFCVGLLNLSLVGLVAIWGFNLLVPTAAVDYSILNIFAINLIRFALLKIEKDD